MTLGSVRKLRDLTQPSAFNFIQVTLGSVRKLRDLANDVLLDGMFYTVPGTRELIVRSVVSEANRIVALYRELNPGFAGRVSLLGHSLGSVICFDVCSLQQQGTPPPGAAAEEEAAAAEAAANTADARRRENAKLAFVPFALFLVGSPLGVFECVRIFGDSAAGSSSSFAPPAAAPAGPGPVDAPGGLGHSFQLPTPTAVFNVFDPNDPVAYRVEPLLLPDLHAFEPEFVPLATGGAPFQLRAIMLAHPPPPRAPRRTHARQHSRRHSKLSIPSDARGVPARLSRSGTRQRGQAQPQH